MKKILFRWVAALLPAVLMLSCGSAPDVTVQGQLSGEEAASYEKILLKYGKDVVGAAAVENGSFTLTLPAPEEESLQSFSLRRAQSSRWGVIAVFKDENDYLPMMCMGENGYAEYLYVAEEFTLKVEDAELPLQRGWNTIVVRYDGKSWKHSLEPVPADYKWVSERDGEVAMDALFIRKSEKPGWFDGTFTGKLADEITGKVKSVKAIAERSDFRRVEAGGHWGYRGTLATATVTDGRFTLSLPALDDRYLKSLDDMVFSLFSGTNTENLNVEPADLKLAEIRLLTDGNHTLSGNIPKVTVYILYASSDGYISGGANMKRYGILLKKGWNVVTYTYGSWDDIIKAEAMPVDMEWDNSRLHGYR